MYYAEVALEEWARSLHKNIYTLITYIRGTLNFRWNVVNFSVSITCLFVSNLETCLIILIILIKSWAADFYMLIIDMKQGYIAN